MTSRRRLRSSAVPKGFVPGSAQVQAELDRVRARDRAMFAGAIAVAAVVLATLAVLVLSLYVLPVVRVSGTSMEPALQGGDVVIAVRDADPSPGDLVAFYYGNELLVKRVVAGPGSWVDILADGTVTVNAVPLDEPYVVQKTRGECTVELPYQVPQDSYFVLGDNRGVSADSRTALIGAVGSDQIVGRLAVRVWPLTRFGLVG